MYYEFIYIYGIWYQEIDEYQHIVISAYHKLNPKGTLRPNFICCAYNKPFIQHTFILLTVCLKRMFILVVKKYAYYYSVLCMFYWFIVMYMHVNNCD